MYRVSETKCVEEMCDVPVEEKRIIVFIDQLRETRVQYSNLAGRLSELLERVQPQLESKETCVNVPSPPPVSGHMQEMENEKFMLDENINTMYGLIEKLERIF